MFWRLSTHRYCCGPVEVVPGHPARVVHVEVLAGRGHDGTVGRLERHVEEQRPAAVVAPDNVPCLPVTQHNSAATACVVCTSTWPPGLGRTPPLPAWRCPRPCASRSPPCPGACRASRGTCISTHSLYLHSIYTIYSVTRL